MNRDELADYLGLFGNEIIARKTRKRRKHDGKTYRWGFMKWRKRPFRTVRAEYSARLVGREADYPMKARACLTPMFRNVYCDDDHDGPYKPSFSR